MIRTDNHFVDCLRSFLENHIEWFWVSDESSAALIVGTNCSIVSRRKSKGEGLQQVGKDHKNLHIRQGLSRASSDSYNRNDKPIVNLLKESICLTGKKFAM